MISPPHFKLHVKRISITARGGGTSQCGQTVEGLIIDASKINRVLNRSRKGGSPGEPGLVLDQLNAQLKPWVIFPVDVSTSSRNPWGDDR